MLTCVESTRDHVDPFLADLRWVDRREWVAATGQRTRDQLLAAFEAPNVRMRTLLLDGERPVCMWGVYDVFPDTPGRLGQAWLAAQEAAVPHVHAIHRLLKPELHEIDKRWRKTIAYAFEPNTLHRKWMERAGYRPRSLEFLGPWRSPFIVYTRKRDS